MRGISRGWAAAAAAVLSLGASSGAVAAPGHWNPVGTTGQLDISELVGLARTSDGTLHVGWHRRTPEGLYDLLETPITAPGAVGAPVPIVTGWASIEGPSLVAPAPGSSLAAFFSGNRTRTTGDPSEGINMATSGDSGRAAWDLAPAAIASGDFASSRDAGVVAVGGTFVQSWYAGEETVVHAGLDKAVAAQRGYGSGTNQNLAADAAGAVLVAWCTGVQGANGVFVQSVDPSSGAPVGAASLMPGSTAMVGGTAESFCPASSRVPLVAREGGGFYVVSTDVKRLAVRIWRAGSAASATLAGGAATKQQLALAAAPSGRLWVGWMEDGKLKLRRSNRSATVFGATVTVGTPPGDGIYQLDLSGQADRVDAITRTQGGSGVALYHAQSYPGLTLTAGGGRRAVFRVTDAGDAVAGATIRVAGRTLKTNSQGRASATLNRGRFTATASKDKYVSASTSVRVR
jgi:hypothetical protein